MTTEQAASKGDLDRRLLGAESTPLRRIVKPRPYICAQRPPNARDLPAATVPVDIVAGRNTWTTLGNLDYNNCTVAGVIHILQAAAWASRNEQLDITDAVAAEIYENLTQWRPGNPPDHGPGLSVEPMMKYAFSNGVTGRKIGSYYRSKFLPGFESYPRRKRTTPNGILNMLAWFGGVGLTFYCPEKARKSNGPWRGAEMDGPITGEHFIPIISYDGSWLKCISWGNVIALDWDFISRFTSEIWYCYANDWVGPTGSVSYRLSAPELFDTMALDAIQEDFPICP